MFLLTFDLSRWQSFAVKMRLDWLKWNFNLVVVGNSDNDDDLGLNGAAQQKAPRKREALFDFNARVRIFLPEDSRSSQPD